MATDGPPNYEQLGFNSQDVAVFSKIHSLQYEEGKPEAAQLIFSKLPEAQRKRYAAYRKYRASLTAQEASSSASQRSVTLKHS